MTKSRGIDVFMPMTGADVTDGCNRWFADAMKSMKVAN